MTPPIDDAPMRDDELLIARRFDAPPALVFRLWESREHRLRWWGPKEFTCTHFEHDFRVGGAWRACIASQTYGDHWMSGEYREILRDRRIVFTFRWEDADDANPPSLVTVTLEPSDGGTEQRFHQAPFASVDSRDSHVGGWNECLDREAGYVAQLTAQEQGA